MWEHGARIDGTHMRRFIKDTNLQNFFMTRREGRRTCFNWHVGDDATKVTHDKRPGALQIKSKWIDHKASNAKKRVHDVPPKKEFEYTITKSYETSRRELK